MTKIASANVIEPEVADKPTGEEQRADQVEWDKLREHFASQPKVTIRVADDQFVQINGYTFIIKGGERVSVPQGVADILEQSGRI